MQGSHTESPCGGANARSTHPPMRLLQSAHNPSGCASKILSMVDYTARYWLSEPDAVHYFHVTFFA